MQLRAFFAKSYIIDGCVLLSGGQEIEVLSRLPATQILLICLPFTAPGRFFTRAVGKNSSKQKISILKKIVFLKKNEIWE